MSDDQPIVNEYTLHEDLQEVIKLLKMLIVTVKHSGGQLY